MAVYLGSTADSILKGRFLVLSPGMYQLHTINIYLSSTTVLCLRPFNMRSDSELLLFICRSEK